MHKIYNQNFLWELKISWEPGFQVPHDFLTLHFVQKPSGEIFYQRKELNKKTFTKKYLTQNYLTKTTVQKKYFKQKTVMKKTLFKISIVNKKNFLQKKRYTN